MCINKAISILVISGLLMPLQLPPFFISEAVADEPVAFPSIDPSSMTSDTAVSAGSFATMADTSESMVSTMNTLAEIAGPVAPSTTTTAEVISPAATVDSLTEAPVAPVASALLSPQELAAAILAAQNAMNGPVDDFVTSQWTGFFGVPARPLVKSKIKEELNMVIGVVIPTGGTISFSTVNVVGGKNLVVDMTYPGGITFNITVSIIGDPSCPKTADINKSFSTNIVNVFTTATINVLKGLLKIIIDSIIGGPPTVGPEIALSTETSAVDSSMEEPIASLTTETTEVVPSITTIAAVVLPEELEMQEVPVLFETDVLSTSIESDTEILGAMPLAETELGLSYPGSDLDILIPPDMPIEDEAIPPPSPIEEE